MRRVGDILIAVILLACTLPLMALVALAIKLDSPGPVVVRRRVTRVTGSPIEILSFRTTSHQVQNRRSKWDAANRTPVGRFLNQTRIEDLPQLVNVLRGELTLIGTGQGRLHFLD